MFLVTILEGLPSVVTFELICSLNPKIVSIGGGLRAPAAVASATALRIWDMDIKANCEDGTKLNLEIQVRKEKDYEKIA